MTVPCERHDDALDNVAQLAHVPGRISTRRQRSGKHHGGFAPLPFPFPCRRIMRVLRKCSEKGRDVLLALADVGTTI